MQGKDYIFAIQDKNYNFYQVDENKNVIVSSRPYFLRFAPSGWEEISIQMVRNKTYWGLERSVSIPFDYVGDGSMILKDVFYDLDTEKGVYLSILSLQLDFDKVKGEINTDTLQPGIRNECLITGIPGQEVYLKLTPSTSSEVGIYIDSGDGMYHQFGLLSDGDFSVFPLTIPASGQYAFVLYFVGDEVSAEMSLSSGSTISSYGFWYKQIFRGEIDLTEWNHSGFKVTAPTLEDGITKFLKANEKTEYEFEFDDFVNVKMDGIRMHNKSNFNVMAMEDKSQMHVGYRDYKALGVTFVNEEGDKWGVTTISQMVEQIGTYASDADNYVTTSLNYFLINELSYPVEFHISGKIIFDTVLIISYDQSYRLYFQKNTGEKFEFFNQRTYEGVRYTADFDYNITLQPNERLFLLAGFPDSDPGFSSSIIKILDNSDFSVVFITRRDATFIKAFRPQKLFEKLIDKLTDSAFRAGISHFLTQRQNIVITSSNAIRNLPDATLKLSFADFFKFWDSLYSVSLTRDIRLELKEHAIDFSNPIILPSPEQGSMNISVEKEYLFNELQIGYPEIGDDVGTLNGNEEWNSKTVFSLGATTEPKVLDKLSPVKASCYVIEKIRITQLEKDTTAYASDNDTFALHVESILRPGNDDTPEHYQLDRSLNATATGLLEPQSVFNLALSPKRMLLNNGAFIRSSLLLSESRILKFISADKNDKVQSGTLTEKEDITLGQLKPRFFHPVVFSFQVAPPLNIDDILTPGRGFVFPFNGEWFYGIPDNIAYSTQKSLRSFKLLSYALNDLKKLKSYNG